MIRSLLSSYYLRTLTNPHVTLIVDGIWSRTASSYIRKSDISTPIFNEALFAVRRDSHRWIKTYEYENFDSWIDYGEERFEKIANPTITLLFIWTNWEEGEITGPQDIVEQLISDATTAYQVQEKVKSQSDASV